MSYDSLINQLADDLKPVRRRGLKADLTFVGVICGIELLLFFRLGMARAGMPSMLQQPSFWWRLASLALISGISAILAALSFNPAFSPRRGIRAVGVLVLVCLGTGLCISAGPDGLKTLVQRLDWFDGLHCAGKVIALSLPPVVGLGILMRRGAPTDMRATSVLVGLAAAAWGGLVFVFACPFDDPLYIAVWYSTGCGVVVALARMLLPRLARW
jgi:hypothetical protein